VPLRNRERRAQGDLSPRQRVMRQPSLRVTPKYMQTGEHCQHPDSHAQDGVSGVMGYWGDGVLGYWGNGVMG